MTLPSPPSGSGVHAMSRSPTHSTLALAPSELAHCAPIVLSSRESAVALPSPSRSAYASVSTRVVVVASSSAPRARVDSTRHSWLNMLKLRASVSHLLAYSDCTSPVGLMTYRYEL